MCSLKSLKVTKYLFLFVRYIKEKERYDLQSGQKMPHLQIQQKAQFSRWQQCKGSCFCFCRRSKLVMDEDVFDFPM